MSRSRAFTMSNSVCDRRRVTTTDYTGGLMTDPTDRAIPELRTRKATSAAVRRLTAEVSAELGGVRVTHDDLIYALTYLAVAHKAELVALLRPVSEGTNATE